MSSRLFPLAAVTALLVAFKTFAMLAQTGAAPEVQDTGVPKPPAGFIPQSGGIDGSLAGTWRGDDWGEVVLKRIADDAYEGTYTDTFGKDVGRIRLKWSATNRRFDGSWGEGVQRHGRISVRIHPERRTIRGAYTTDLSCLLHPGVPSLADLEWQRVPQEANKVDSDTRPAGLKSQSQFQDF